jgi:hypothetical protein
MKVVLGVGLVVLGLGFIELINPLWFQETLHLQIFLNARGPLWSVKSLFFHPVLFSWFTALIAIFTWAWYLDSKRRLAFALAALFSLGPFLGQRRRAIAALLNLVVIAHRMLHIVADLFSEMFLERNIIHRNVVTAKVLGFAGANRSAEVTAAITT